jgi:transcription-repair coupling factor (superfamily II helicase)
MDSTLIAPALAKLYAESDEHSLIITPSYERASKLAESLGFFTDRKILLLPDGNPFLFRFEAKSREELDDRLRALIALRREEPVAIVASASAVLKKMLPPGIFNSQSAEFHVSRKYVDRDIREKMVEMGYERVPFVEATGEYSARGDILDIYPADTRYPVRLEFFGDELEGVRFFDPDTQKSIKKLDGFTLYPAAEFLPTEEMRARAKRRCENNNELAVEIETMTNRQLLENYIEYFTDTPFYLTDYLPAGAAVILDDPMRLIESVTFEANEAERDLGDVTKIFSGNKTIIFTRDGKIPPEYTGTSAVAAGLLTYEYHAKTTPLMGGSLDLLCSELRRYLNEDYEVTIVASSDNRYESLGAFLADNDFTDRVTLTRGSLAAGIELTSEKKVWLFDGDIFRTSKTKRRLKSMDDRRPIRAFTELEPGDYVVHEIHGIARFDGIEQKIVQDVRRDYLKLSYAGGDIIYVPVDMMRNVQKYIGGGEEGPKLNRLAGSEWKRVKARAKAAIANMASELVELAAARKQSPGYAFSPDTVWQREFEDRFPYEETGDQLRAIASVKADMERPEAMERLLCGDVGYGKTEVALRAVFKCVCDGKQAAVLVPTTILAGQHFKTFTQRFEDFPFRVEMLSRFRNVAEQKRIVSDLARGAVDVVIGTHRILSSDVKFRDLGFLVVDEEQRFGVRDKEKIKKLKNNIDVLSMTATPIPRTLHMSLMGIRDMDVIEEPPENRYPVQTYVAEESDEIIRETILRELGRGGQVYAVTSRINHIDRIVSDITRLAPSAGIAIGHGRMNERELEDVMIDFVDGKYDVLISTSIIESGIDIPNVNTILIFDADRFGLSQLYQLRGRVGRTNRVAFAYLLHTKGKMLSEAAEKRLRTIRDFTEFGAGFKIAIRDLEIRGAGDMLGSSQHGHMAAVGYEMYLRLVEDAVSAAGGVAPEPEPAEVHITIDAPAYIPAYYIEDESAKLQVYRNISLAQSAEDESGIINELDDRFGAVPESVKNLIAVARIRYCAERLGIVRVTENGSDMLFTFADADGITQEMEEVITDGGDGSARISRGRQAVIKLFAPTGRERLRRSLDLLCDIINK